MVLQGMIALIKRFSAATVKFSRCLLSMNSKFFKILNVLQQSQLCPARFRTKILRVMGVLVGRNSIISHGVFFGGKNVYIGDFVFINIGCFFDGSAPIRIEDYSRIGPYCRFLTGSHEYRASEIRRDPRDQTIGAPISVDLGCWIGMGSSIMPGVSIGRGVVVGASSLITKDVNNNSLVAGVPAKVIKELPTTLDGVKDA